MLGLTDDNQKLRVVHWNGLKYYFPLFSKIDWDAIEERGGPRSKFQAKSNYQVKFQTCSEALEQLMRALIKT